jgi:hypothetical protein
MNFLRNAWMVTPPSVTIVDCNYAADVGTINTIMNAMGNVGYESDEPMPKATVITNAARSLCSVPIQGAQISPFYGEVNITWKHGHDRVKATFGPAQDMFFVYRECFEGGRVTDSHLEEHATEEYLRQSLDWLRTHHQNV